MKAIAKIFFLLIPFISFCQEKANQTSSSIFPGHETYHKYEGDYYFSDGTYITGGPMDEVKGSLVFMDPIGLSKGGLFLSKTETIFISIQDSTNKIRFDLDEKKEVKGLWWQTTGNEPVYATKRLNYTLQKVQFKSGDNSLTGELYLPLSKGPHPLVIHVHGSGKQTRHGGPWNTFFLNYGMAVLSYDKRGVGESTGNYSTAGYEDLANDVLAAVKFARLLPQINASKIGLHGSSEGGWVSSIAASNSDELSFMIIRAGSGVSGSDTYMYETKNELLEKNLSQEEYIQAVQFERTIQDMAAADKPLAEVNAYIKETREKNTWFPKAFGNYREMNPSYWIKLKKTGPVDPAHYLRKISDLPVLWFLAEKDENVPYQISKLQIESALEEAGNNDYEIVTIQNAKHSFLVYSPDGTVKYADGYWNKMISWIMEHVTGNK